MEDFKEISYINKIEVLESFSETEIFKLVFNEIPVIGKKYLSPFRVDNNPSCEFNYFNNKLYFSDFAYNINYDCFEAIKIYFKLDNFYEVLKFLKQERKSHTIEKNSPIQLIKKQIKKTPKLYINPRESFNMNDKRFWEPYEISLSNLVEDFVYPVKEFLFLNTKWGNIHKVVNTPAYAYTNFNSGNIKIYLPFNKKGKKFISDCKSYDIGGIDRINYNIDYIIITKSYKDYRVLYNLNYNTIWLQNEGVLPKELFDIIKFFKFIYIFFDNDLPGIKASAKIMETIQKRYKTKQIISIRLNELTTKDPSDFIKKFDKKLLIKFLENVIGQYS